MKTYHDLIGNTLSVWFAAPTKEVFCEEIADDVVLIKDRRGRIIGFERLNYSSRKQQAEGGQVPVEVQALRQARCRRQGMRESFVLSARAGGKPPTGGFVPAFRFPLPLVLLRLIAPIAYLKS